MYTTLRKISWQEGIRVKSKEEGKRQSGMQIGGGREESEGKEGMNQGNTEGGRECGTSKRDRRKRM